MRIEFRPIIMDFALAVTKAGDLLTINGESFDFSALPAGGMVPAGEVPCDFIVGPVERDEDDGLSVTLLLPCRYDAPPARLNPSPIISPPDGPITLPGE